MKQRAAALWRAADRSLKMRLRRLFQRPERDGITMMASRFLFFSPSSGCARPDLFFCEENKSFEAFRKNGLALCIEKALQLSLKGFGAGNRT